MLNGRVENLFAFRFLSAGTGLLMMFVGSAFAQGLDSLLEEPAVPAEQSLPPPESVSPPPPPPPQILSPGEIPQGFGAQVQPPPPAPEEPAPVVAQPPVTGEALAAVVEVPKVDPYPHYEVFLDTIESLAKELFKVRQRLDSLKAVVNEETLQPKGQYEKQADYDYRKNNFDKIKQQKLADVEKKNSADEKKARDKLTSAMGMSRDVQPDWQGLLSKNADADEYKRRIDKFADKTAEMNIVFTRINNFLARLDIKQGDMDALARKNNLFVARMERASDLMRDYILQDYSQVKTTEKKKYEMALGQYDVEKEEYPLNLRDLNSQVPFDFHGLAKASPGMAQLIDGKTEDFTAVVEYINYPFTAYGARVYPGGKKANLFFRDQPIATTGAFKLPDDYKNLEGFGEWAVRADSINTGKLLPKGLDSSYAMKKVSVGPKFWNTKRVLRAVALGLSAASLGVAVWQNSEVDKKGTAANKLYNEASKAIDDGNKPVYDKKAKDYTKKIDSMESSIYVRNGFYISAGVFGTAGIVSFFF